MEVKAHHETAFEGHYARVEHEHAHRGASGASRPVFKLDRPLSEGELAMVRSMAAAQKEMRVGGTDATENEPVSFIDMWTTASLTELSAAIEKAKAVKVDTAAAETRLQALCRVTLERALKASVAASAAADEQLTHLSDEEVGQVSVETQVQVSGCGDEQFNGVYEPDGENNAGVTRWRRRGGDQTITPQGGTWYMAKDHRGSWWYRVGSSNKLPPTSGWEVSSDAEGPAPNVVVTKRLPDYYKTSQLSATIEKARDVGIDVAEAEARLHELKSLAAKASLEVATRAAKLAPDDSVVSAVTAAIEDAKAAGVDTTDAAAQLAALRKSVAAVPLTAALDAANAAHDAHQTRTSLGVNWVNIGSEPPVDGVELTCPKLAFALKQRTEFPLEDLKVFEVPMGDLKESHYIRSDSTYFKPVVPEATTVLTARDSRRWITKHPGYDERMLAFKLNNGAFELLGDRFQLEPASSSAALSFKCPDGEKLILQSFDGRTATWISSDDDDDGETIVWEVSRSRA